MIHCNMTTGHKHGQDKIIQYTKTVKTPALGTEWFPYVELDKDYLPLNFILSDFCIINKTKSFTVMIDMKASHPN